MILIAASGIYKSKSGKILPYYNVKWDQVEVGDWSMLESRWLSSVLSLAVSNWAIWTNESSAILGESSRILQCRKNFKICRAAMWICITVQLIDSDCNYYHFKHNSLPPFFKGRSLISFLSLTKLLCVYIYSTIVLLVCFDVPFNLPHAVVLFDTLTVLM